MQIDLMLSDVRDSLILIKHVIEKCPENIDAIILQPSGGWPLFTTQPQECVLCHTIFIMLDHVLLSVVGLQITSASF